MDDIFDTTTMVRYEELWNTLLAERDRTPVVRDLWPIGDDAGAIAQVIVTKTNWTVSVHIGLRAMAYDDPTEPIPSRGFSTASHVLSRMAFDMIFREAYMISKAQYEHLVIGEPVYHGVDSLIGDPEEIVTAITQFIAENGLSGNYEEMTGGEQRLWMDWIDENRTKFQQGFVNRFV